jgi:mannose-6-phosphate isomerase-like protein (cupin superfamily)
MKQMPCVLFALAAVVGASAAEPPAASGHYAATKALADLMAQPPLVEVENSFRGWAVERSEDFGVVLIEVLGTIPLHMHPDGNRRMFLVEGRMKMLGGDHEMEMKPGDFMYLPRNHHHKVWLAPNTERALFMLVDNPPTSTSNVIWLESAPQIKWNRDQAKTAVTVKDRCEPAAPRPGH